MSGIFGYIKKTDSVEESSLAKLSEWNSGQEEREVFRKSLGRAALGCCLEHFRKNVTEDKDVLCEAGKYYGVFDALIYNREELVTRIIAHNADKREKELEKMSDERLLFTLFLLEGAMGLKNVNGDFTGAVYDAEENTLIIFRDHLGIRPLYVYEDEKIFAFSTDYRGLLAMPEANRSINEAYFYEKVSGHSIKDEELTDFLYIRAVAPAHIIKYKGKEKRVEKTCYWYLGENKIRFSTEEEYFVELKRLVKDSIERRLNVNTAVVGGELSGGLDSTVIDVMLHKSGRKSVFCSWSPGIDAVPLQKLDERENIEYTCKKFGMKCEYVDASWYDEEVKLLQELEGKWPVDGYMPVIDECMKFFSSQKVKVAFSGWGGDEGVSHRANPLELWINHEYKEYFTLWWNRTKGEKLRILRFAKRVVYNLTRDKRLRMKPWDYYQWNNIEKVQYFNREFVGRAKGKLENTPIYFSFDPIKQIENGGNRRRMEVAAACGAMRQIRYVFPFLDYRVIDFAVSIPRKMYLRGWKNRYIFRETFREELGEKLYNYQYKDDPGKSLYYKEKSSDRFKILCTYIMSRLDRGYWANYLDFDKLQKQIDNIIEKKNDYDNEMAITDLLVRCYQIQVLQNI